MVDDLIAYFHQRPEQGGLGGGGLEGAYDHQPPEERRRAVPFLQPFGHGPPYSHMVNEAEGGHPLQVQPEEEGDVDPHASVLAEAAQVGVEVPKRRGQGVEAVQRFLGNLSVPDEGLKARLVPEKHLADDPFRRPSAHRSQPLLVLVEQVTDEVVQIGDAEGGDDHPPQHGGADLHGHTGAGDHQGGVQGGGLEGVHEIGQS